LAERLIQFSFHLPRLVGRVPQLACDEQVLSLHLHAGIGKHTLGIGKKLSKSFADFTLISVTHGEIKMAIAMFDCNFNLCMSINSTLKAMGSHE
jgi:hypothetical protein